MAITPNFLIMFAITLLIVSMTCAQNCKKYKFPNKMVYKSCTDLPTLGAHLHWNPKPSTNTVQIAYRATQTPNGWVAWGINPEETGMVGTQALVTFQDGKGKMKVYSTKISSYSPGMKPEALNFSVTELKAEYVKNEMIIYGVLGELSNGTSLNIVWQAGDSVKNDIPQMHPLGGQNVKSFTALDFLST